MSTDDTEEQRQEHQWHAATWVPLDAKQARFAARRGSARLSESVRVEVLDVVCLRCRRDFLDVHDRDCVDRTATYLQGGHPGERAKPRRAGAAAPVEIRP